MPRTGSKSERTASTRPSRAPRRAWERDSAPPRGHITPHTRPTRPTRPRSRAHGHGVRERWQLGRRNCWSLLRFIIKKGFVFCLFFKKKHLALFFLLSLSLVLSKRLHRFVLFCLLFVFFDRHYLRPCPAGVRPAEVLVLVLLLVLLLGGGSCAASLAVFEVFYKL